MVPEKGVEPSRPCGQRILSPPRLPFRHSGVWVQSSGFAGMVQARAWRGVSGVAGPSGLIASRSKITPSLRLETDAGEHFVEGGLQLIEVSLRGDKD